jgi:hypothetical protein
MGETEMANKHQHGRRQNGHGGLGLLFTSKTTYTERIWEAVYRQALAQGKTTAQAEKLADAAARDAKTRE